MNSQPLPNKAKQHYFFNAYFYKSIMFIHTHRNNFINNQKMSEAQLLDFTVKRFIKPNIITFKYQKQQELPLSITVKELTKKKDYTFYMNHDQLVKLCSRIIYRNYFDESKFRTFLQERNIEYVFKWQNNQLKIDSTDIVLKAKASPPEEQTKPQYGCKSIDSKRRDPSLQQATAIIAVKTISFIANIQIKEYSREQISLSFRQQLLNFLKQHFDNQQFRPVFMKIIELFAGQMQNKQQEDNFDFSVLQNQRFRNSSIQSNKIIFNPTFLTAQIFQIITEEFRYNQFLIGQGGLGKSISEFLLVNLSKFIDRYIIRTNEQNQIDSLQTISNFLEGKEMSALLNFPKLYYISLTQSDFNSHMLKAIKSQTFFDLNQEDIGKILQKIQRYYQRKNRSVTFIIDQINVYTALIRQRENGSNKDIFKCMTKFLDSIQSNGFQMIYISSVNFESKHVKSKEFGIHTFLDRRNQIQQSSLGKYKERFSRESYIETIHWIQFQLQMRLFSWGKMQFCSIWNAKFKQFFEELTKKGLPTNEQQIKSAVRQVTPLAINKYFSVNRKQLQKLIEGPQQRSASQQIRNLVHEIKQEARSELASHYQRFLEKGDSQTREQKYYLYLQILATAKQQRKTDSSSFKVELLEKTKDKLAIRQLDLINKEHALVDFQKSTIQIFYPPKVFLKIAQQIRQPLQTLSKLFQKYFTQIAENETLFAFMLDKSYTSLISRQSVSLKFEEYSFDLQGQNGFFINFNHYGKLATNLSEIIKKVQKSGQKGKYFGAFPAKRSKNRQDFVYCANSKVIDALIIGKSQNKKYMFKLITFDFTITFSKSKIDRKKLEAQKFFQQLEKNENQQNQYAFTDFEITHYIVAPQMVINQINQRGQQTQGWHQQGNFEILLTPIQLFKIDLLKDKKNWFDQKQLQSIHQILLKRDSERKPNNEYQ